MNMTTEQIAKSLGVNSMSATLKSGGAPMRVTNVRSEPDGTLRVGCEFPDENGFLRFQEFSIDELAFRDRAGAPVELSADIEKLRGVK